MQGGPQYGSVGSQLTRFWSVVPMEELVYQQNMKTLDVLLNHILDAAPSVKDCGD